MTPFAEAFDRASRGLDWSRPCLIWVADYLLAVTGRDPAEGWRETVWDERKAKATLARLAVHGVGETAVERALDVVAKRDGWIEADAPMQGAVMIGVYRRGARDGIPAIFDGNQRWLVGAMEPCAIVVPINPDRMWEIACPT